MMSTGRSSSSSSSSSSSARSRREFWLTNYAGGPNGPAAGGSVDPADWGAAANAICSDTNGEVVDLDRSLGPEAEPAEALSRGERILGRCADSLAELPAPSDREVLVAQLVIEMREVQAVMQRVRDAVERGDLDQAERLTLGFESEAVTRLAYALEAPWCDLFGADDLTIRTTASINVLEVQDLLALYREDLGTYAGADLEALRQRYGTTLVKGEAAVRRADSSSYCVESTVGYLTLHVLGPEAAELTPGSC